MATLHVLRPDAELVRRGGRIEVRINGKVRASAPLTLLSSVVIEGRADISTAALHALLREDIPVVFMATGGEVMGRLEADCSGSVALRQRQLRRSLDPQFCLDTTRAIIAGKIRNQRVLLTGRSRRSPSGIKVDSRATVDGLVRLERRVGQCETVASVVGVEGAASAMYFSAIRKMLPVSLHFEGRIRSGLDGWRPRSGVKAGRRRFLVVDLTRRL